jgi:hypothetical protein
MAGALALYCRSLRTTSTQMRRDNISGRPCMGVMTYKALDFFALKTIRQLSPVVHHRASKILMQTKELDMLIMHVGMELNLHNTLCHFLVAQLQDLEPNISRKH